MSLNGFFRRASPDGFPFPVTPEKGDKAVVCHGRDVHAGDVWPDTAREVGLLGCQGGRMKDVCPVFSECHQFTNPVVLRNEAM